MNLEETPTVIQSDGQLSVSGSSDQGPVCPTDNQLATDSFSSAKDQIDDHSLIEVPDLRDPGKRYRLSRSLRGTFRSLQQTWQSESEEENKNRDQAGKQEWQNFNVERLTRRADAATLLPSELARAQDPENPNEFSFKTTEVINGDGNTITIPEWAKDAWQTWSAEEQDKFVAQPKVVQEWYSIQITGMEDLKKGKELGHLVSPASFVASDDQVDLQEMGELSL